VVDLQRGARKHPDEFRGWVKQYIVSHGHDEAWADQMAGAVVDVLAGSPGARP
jgi:hypothetical protein